MLVGVGQVTERPDAGSSYASRKQPLDLMVEALERAAADAGVTSLLAHLDEIVLDWVAGPDFDDLLVQTVRAGFPRDEHDQFIAHFRGLLALWVRDEAAR